MRKSPDNEEFMLRGRTNIVKKYLVWRHTRRSFETWIHLQTQIIKSSISFRHTPEYIPLKTPELDLYLTNNSCEIIRNRKLY